jgi:hypothetical protein
MFRPAEIPQSQLARSADDLRSGRLPIDQVLPAHAGDTNRDISSLDLLKLRDGLSRR